MHVKKTLDTHASRVTDIHTKKISWQIPRQDTPSYLHNLAPGECFGYLFVSHQTPISSSIELVETRFASTLSTHLISDIDHF